MRALQIFKRDIRLILDKVAKGHMVLWHEIGWSHLNKGKRKTEGLLQSLCK